MQLKDFKIGDKFYIAAGEWTVPGIGTRTVVAYNSSVLENQRSWTFKITSFFINMILVAAV